MQSSIYLTCFIKEKTLDSATCVELILIYKRPIRQYLVEVMEPLRGPAFTLSPQCCECGDISGHTPQSTKSAFAFIFKLKQVFIPNLALGSFLCCFAPHLIKKTGSPESTCCKTNKTMKNLTSMLQKSFKLRIRIWSWSNCLKGQQKLLCPLWFLCGHCCEDAADAKGR